MKLRALLVAAVLAFPVAAAAQTSPYPGQPGKDVVWVPSPSVLVEKMLDLASVTPQDFVIDLGSGDGRNVIAAARRGARALGVEWESDLVLLSQRYAAEAGVGERARFVQGDMFEFDISNATVLALFLLPANLKRLEPKFLKLAPGTRIVNNGYRIDGWTEHSSVEITGECAPWCSSYLYLVPANVAGTWKLPVGELVLEQAAQSVTGTLRRLNGTSAPVGGVVQGDRIEFKAGLDAFTGRIRGNEMTGTAQGAFSGAWRAVRDPG